MCVCVCVQVRVCAVCVCVCVHAQVRVCVCVCSKTRKQCLRRTPKTRYFLERRGQCCDYVFIDVHHLENGAIERRCKPRLLRLLIGRVCVH